MEPKEAQPDNKVDSSETGHQALSIAAHDAIEDICRILGWRLLDAYEAYAQVASRTKPADRWWHEAVLRCCVDMLLIECHFSPAAVKEVVLEYLAGDTSAAEIVDYAERIRTSGAPSQDTLRLPDLPSPELCIPAPFDLPRPGRGERIEVRRDAVRLPDPVFSEVEPT
jgi:hypothetical protein